MLTNFQRVSMQNPGNMLTKMKYRSILYLFVVCVVIIGSPAQGDIPAFAEKPKVSEKGGKIAIEFSVTEGTPVTVEIIDKQGRTVRHLAAGMLGKNPPAPFEPGLKQTVLWDRKDDNGAPVKERCRARIGLGLKAEVERIMGWSGPLHGDLVSIVTGRNGMLNVIHIGARKRGYRRQAYVSSFDRNGKYIGTIVLHDPSLKGDEAHGLKIFDIEGRKIPAVVYRYRTKSIPSIYPKGYTYAGKLYPDSYGTPQTSAFSPVRGIVIVQKLEKKSRIIAIGSDGTVSKGPDLAEQPGPECHIALMPDSKGIILSTVGKLYRGNWEDDTLSPMKHYDGLKGPGAVACGSDGRIYAADPEGDRIAVFNTDGSTAGSLKIEKPCEVCVHPKTGAVYAVTGDSRLVKFSGAGERGGLLAEMPLLSGGRIMMSVDTGSAEPVVWIAYERKNSRPEVWRIEDRGRRFVKKEVIKFRESRLDKIFRIAAHPDRDEIFLKQYFGGRIKKTGNILRMDGKTGETTSISVTAHEIAVDSKGFLYGTFHKQLGMKVDLAAGLCRVTKYDRNGKPVAIKDGKSSFTFQSQDRGSGEGGRGFTVAPNGDIYILYYEPYDQGSGRHYGPGPVWLNVFNPDGTKKKYHFIGGFTQGVSGVAVDREDNIYIGEAVKPVGRIYPEGYTGIGLPSSRVDINANAPKMPNDPWIWNGGANWYFMLQGTMLKFGPEGGAIWWERGYHTKEPPDFEGTAKYWRIRQPKAGNYDLRSAPVKIKGEKWAWFGVSPVPQGSGGGFGFPVSIFGQSHTKHCVCHQTRFVLDRHDRLIFPDSLGFSIIIMDSEKNELLRFGGFNNLNSSCHGSPVPQPSPPEVSFGWATHVAANDHAVYISDPINRRIIKAKLMYTKEEIVRMP